MEEKGPFIYLTGDRFVYRLNKNAGTFDSMTWNGKLLTCRPMEFSVYRAPTDNDQGTKETWKSAGLNRTLPYPYETTVSQVREGVEIRCPLSLQAVYMANLAEIQAVWTVHNSGTVIVRLDVEIPDWVPWLPRFGLQIYLSNNFNQCAYFGYGPYESYCDKHCASWKDWFVSDVAGLHEDYIRPQENGSHFSTEELWLSAGSTKLTVQAPAPFSFSVSPYTWKELEEKAHNFDLEESGYTVLSLDYKMSGVGSSSCGPELPDQYRFNEKTFQFEFVLIPGVI